MAELRLYDYFESGNAYKVRLLLTLLGRPFERVHLDILNAETRTDAFLAKNPNHRVPLLELADGQVLAESNAILFYLARETRFWPDDAFAQAEALQWMFFEQYSHEPALAVMRYLRHFTDHPDRHAGRFAELEPQARRALGVMESRLSGHDWLAAEGCTIADFALYPYTHTAGSVGFDVSRFPGIERWLERVESQPRFVPFGYEGEVETLSFAEYFGSEPEE